MQSGESILSTESWHPVLTNGQQDRVAELLDVLVPAIREAPYSAPGISHGLGGPALLHAHLAVSGRHGASHDDTVDLVVEAFAKSSAVPTAPVLYSGFLGLAWLAEHMRGLGFPIDEDANDDIDEVVLTELEQSGQREFDLLNGIVGGGVYALERRGRGKGDECVTQVIAALARRAIQDEEGVRWRSRPEWSRSPTGQNPYPLGAFNLGVAHGIPGVIGFLAAVCQRDEFRAAGAELLKGAVTWLLRQELDETSPSVFPYAVADGVPPEPARLAWCYGDLGIAISLLRAGAALKNESWLEEAQRIVLRACRRQHDRSGVVDAGLCHGIAGIAHMLNRVYQFTGNATCGDAAREWFDLLIRSFRTDRPNVGGVSAWRLLDPRTSTFGWDADPGLLEGASGVALALLGATTANPPTWDRLFLLDLPYPESSR